MKRRGFASTAVTLAMGMVAFGSPSARCIAQEATHQQVAFVQVRTDARQPAGPEIGNAVLAGRYATGMRIALADFENVGGSMRVVTDGFECATDPVWSYDRTRLAFSGKRKADDPLQIWELSVADGQLRPLTTYPADGVSPVYMPDGQIVIASLLAHQYEEHGGHYAFSLYSTPPGGDAPTRLTFNPSSDFDPTVLPDGRILYSSWQHVGNRHWPRGMVALMLVNSDGTGVYPLTGNDSGPWLKRGAKALGADRIAFIQSDRFGDFGAGALVVTSLNDALRPPEALVSPEQFEVSDVSPLPGGELLLSARAVGDPAATFGLYVLKDGAVKLLYDDPKYHELAPAVGSVGSEPERLVSTVEPGTPYGYLAVLNCYDTDLKDQHPIGNGAVKAVRVIEGLPLQRYGNTGPMFIPAAGHEEEPLIRPNSAAGYVPARILGEVPPAADGSVYMKVPADRPLRIQLIDRDGFSLVNERAWFWVRPNERRACMGCHERRELAPNNVVPLATRREPTDLTDPAQWQSVSFRKDIQPILAKNCAVSDCHVPPDPTAGMNLTADQCNGIKDDALASRFGPAYANLLTRQENKPFAVGGRRVHPGNARSSPMLWMLYGRPLAAQYGPAPFDRPLISPHPGPMLPEALLDRIRKWIDLGAQYDDQSPPGAWPYQIPAPNTVVLEHAPDGK